MKTISSGLADHIDLEVTTLATCWRVTRRDGVKFHFTDHDVDLEFDLDSSGAETYMASSSYNRTAIKSDDTLAVDNLDLAGVFDNDEISEEDLRKGLFDFAQIEVFMVNWSDLTQGALKLRRGWLGEVTITPNGYFRAELRGLTQALSRRIGELYSAECRADFGDTRCTFDVDTLKIAFEVTEVDSQQPRAKFTVTELGPESSLPDSHFNGGIVTWDTGDNAGVSMEVRGFLGGDSEQIVEVFLELPYDIQVGDTGTIHPGCDKRFVTCRDRYDNAVNFRGEPYVPGQDQYLSYPDAKA